MVPAAETLRRQLASVDAEAFEKALRAEAYQRLGDFLTGIEAYRRHPYHRDLPDVPVVWQEGSTRLLGYGEPGASGPAVLVVPSLINRGYILDLTAKRSFLRYLAGKGMRPFLVDWDAPGAEEADFHLTDYVDGRLGRALEVVLAHAGRPLVVGYCMGGLLALGIALLRQEAVGGLGLLATPWDFHAPSARAAQLIEGMRPVLTDAINQTGGLSVDLLQSLFATVGPAGIERKFRMFGGLKPGSVRARDFVALEDWLNDGVPLVRGVAEECLFGWYVENQPARGEWRLAGEIISPAAFRKPCLSLVPAADRIVPPQSALALTSTMSKGRHRLVAGGHIGMMTGRNAKADAYAHMAKWIFHVKGES